MTDEQIKQAYKEWIKDYCNNDFLNEDEEEELPGGVELALEKLEEMHSQSPNVASESVSDLSRSFFSSDIPDNIKSLLRPYRRVSFK